MGNSELIQYIKIQMDLGLEKQKIHYLLEKEGWKDHEIKEAFNSIAQQSHHSAQEAKTKEEVIPTDNQKKEGSFLIIWGILEIGIMAAVVFFTLPSLLKGFSKTIPLPNFSSIFLLSFAIVTVTCVLQIIYGIVLTVRRNSSPSHTHHGIFLYGNLLLFTVILSGLFFYIVTSIQNQAYITLNHAKQSSSMKLSQTDMLITIGESKFEKATTLKKKQNPTQEEKDSILRLTNEALIEFTIAARDNPESYHAWYNVGLVYSDSKGVLENWYENGMSAIHHALALQPKNGDAYLILNKLENAQKNYPQAETAQ